MHMNVDTTGIKSLIDGQLALGLKAIEATERLSALQVKAAKAMIEQSAKQQTALLTLKKPQDLAPLANEAVQPFAQISLSFLTEVTALALDSSRNIALTSEAKVQEGYRAVGAWLDQAAKAAPTGTEHMFNLARETLTTSEKAWSHLMQQASAVNDQVELYVVPATTTAKAKGRRAA